MTWPLNGSKAGGDVVLIQTSLQKLQTVWFVVRQGLKQFVLCFKGGEHRRVSDVVF